MPHLNFCGIRITMAKQKHTQKIVPYQSDQYWLLKSEPESYSIDNFQKDKKTLWTGVRNFQARGFMMGSPTPQINRPSLKTTTKKKIPAYPPMQIGDYFIFYHSNAEPSACVGIGQITKLNLVDTAQFDKNSTGYDAKATKERPIWYCCECSFREKFSEPLSLQDLRKISSLAKMLLLQKGSRLSVQPVQKVEFETIYRLANRQSISRETHP